VFPDLVVPSEIAQNVTWASRDSIAVARLSACYGHPLRAETNMFILPPSHETAPCFVGGTCFDFSSDMSRFVLPAMRGETLHSDRTGPCKPYLACFFADGRLESLARKLYGLARLKVPSRLYPAPACLREYMLRFLEEAAHDSPEARAVSRSLATLVAVTFLRSVLPSPDCQCSTAPRHPGAQRAVERIERGFDAPLTLGELACLANLSKSHFMSLFKRSVGRTPHDFLRRVRVEKAKRLLEEGKDVTCACFAVGFTSMSGFEEAF
jgi:AraC-like DNA-binding protein